MSHIRMTAHGACALWSRFWPICSLSLLGLWPLAGQVSRHIDGLDPALTAGSDPAALFAAVLAQTAVLLLVAAFVGATLAHHVGLTSLLAHRRGGGRFIAELPLAMGVGLALGVALALLDLWAFVPLSPSLASGGSGLEQLLLGVLYGGISEEVMMRWGLMTLICWCGMQLLRDRTRSMPAWLAWIGILLSATLFALGHLPAATQAGELDARPIVRVLLLNTLAGTVFGWLYWRRSLESACVAHAVVHVLFYLIA